MTSTSKLPYWTFTMARSCLPTGHSWMGRTAASWARSAEFFPALHLSPDEPGKANSTAEGLPCPSEAPIPAAAAAAARCGALTSVPVPPASSTSSVPSPEPSSSAAAHSPPLPPSPVAPRGWAHGDPSRLLFQRGGELSARPPSARLPCWPSLLLPTRCRPESHVAALAAPVASAATPDRGPSLAAAAAAGRRAATTARAASGHTGRHYHSGGGQAAHPGAEERGSGGDSSSAGSTEGSGGGGGGAGCAGIKGRNGAVAAGAATRPEMGEAGAAGGGGGNGAAVGGGGSGEGGGGSALGRIHPRLMMVFTCAKCETRSTKSFSKQSYTRGVVLVRCPGCQKMHLIADHLCWFGEEPFMLHEFMAAQGLNMLHVTAEEPSSSGLPAPASVAAAAATAAALTAAAAAPGGPPVVPGLAARSAAAAAAAKASEGGVFELGSELQVRDALAAARELQGRQPP